MIIASYGAYVWLAPGAVWFNIYHQLGFDIKHMVYETYFSTVFQNFQLFHHIGNLYSVQVIIVILFLDPKIFAMWFQKSEVWLDELYTQSKQLSKISNVIFNTLN
jgi:predicted membrane protein